MNGVFHVCLAYTQIKEGNEGEVRASLEKARMLARCFDATPSYDASTVRFVAHLDRASAHDNLGRTAMESLENAVKAFGDGTLSALWKEMNEHGE